jgi:hypothetical protein
VKPFIKKELIIRGKKIFNNLPLEIKNVAGNQKKIVKCFEKNVYTLIHFTYSKSTL